MLLPPRRLEGYIFVSRHHHIPCVVLCAEGHHQSCGFNLVFGLVLCYGGVLLG